MFMSECVAYLKHYDATKFISSEDESLEFVEHRERF